MIWGKLQNVLYMRYTICLVYIYIPLSPAFVHITTHKSTDSLLQANKYLALILLSKHCLLFAFSLSNVAYY